LTFILDLKTQQQRKILNFKPQKKLP